MPIPSVHDAAADRQRIVSIDPATGDVVWEGAAASPLEVDRAVQRARAALRDWSSRPLEQRADVLRRFGETLRARHAAFTEIISRETGKPRWEAATETDAMIGKIGATIDAHNERRRPGSRQINDANAGVRYKPHGAVAVFGPYNFPGHLPNGHIMPALLAGNTVVFKPSELAPLVAERTGEIWHEAGLPPGVLNIVQGGRETGQALVAHRDIDGIFFTGSYQTGCAINRALADQPGRIVALEMGGNNPLIVHKVNDLEAAAYWTVHSAYITAGQRCSCARRLIVVGDGADFIERLVRMIGRIRVGKYTDNPEPFIGPVISDQAAERLLAAQEQMLRRGGRAIVPMQQAGHRLAMLRPGLIDVTDATERDDDEHFGPLLQLIRVRDFDAAIAEANNTRFGLSAGLFSDDRSLWEPFYERIRAGVVNFNRPLTGASGQLPFGGIGDSGNHRPSGYFATDYCSYPVATMEVDVMKMPAKLSPGFDT